MKDWIVQHFPEEVVVLYDDDVAGCKTLCGFRNRLLKPEEVEAVVENTAYCAAGAGARVFGWNQSPDPRNLVRNDPFGLNHWVSSVMGVIGKESRWDTLLTFKSDIDLNLSELLSRRIVWQDSRFCFIVGRDKNMGGNSSFRSPERIEAEKRYLSGKWKAHIAFSEYRSQDCVKIKVDRRQRVEL